jgi:hypothetical protein
LNVQIDRLTSLNRRISSQQAEQNSNSNYNDQTINNSDLIAEKIKNRLTSHHLSTDPASLTKFKPILTINEEVKENVKVEAVEITFVSKNVTEKESLNVNEGPSDPSVPTQPILKPSVINPPTILQPSSSLHDYNNQSYDQDKKKRDLKEEKEDVERL